MVNKSIEKIWLICLWLASLALAGCFHIPDEDWLPSRNKVETWNVEKSDEVGQAVNSLLDWFNMISSELNVNDEENKLEIEEVSAEELEEPIIVVEDEIVNNEEMVYDGEIINNENQEIEENITPEE